GPRSPTAWRAQTDRGHWSPATHPFAVARRATTHPTRSLSPRRPHAAGAESYLQGGPHEPPLQGALPRPLRRLHGANRGRRPVDVRPRGRRGDSHRVHRGARCQGQASPHLPALLPDDRPVRRVRVCVMSDQLTLDLSPLVTPDYAPDLTIGER